MPDTRYTFQVQLEWAPWGEGMRGVQTTTIHRATQPHAAVAAAEAQARDRHGAPSYPPDLARAELAGI